MDALSRVACRWIAAMALAAGAGTRILDLGVIAAVGLCSLAVVFVFGRMR